MSTEDVSDRVPGCEPCRCSTDWVESRDETGSVVHLAYVSLTTAVPGAGILSTAELERADRFRFDRDRRRFVTAHVWLRLLLGKLVGAAPEHLEFGHGPYGKPFLARPLTGIKFNMSHAGERVLFGFAWNRDIGVDIEQQREIEVLSMAQHSFSPVERATLALVRPQERLAAFFRCWTRKESFIKATGHGLSRSLNGFDVSLARRGRQLLRRCRDEPTAVRDWRMVDVTREAAYPAALTVAGHAWRVVQWSDPVGHRNYGSSDSSLR